MYIVRRFLLTRFEHKFDIIEITLFKDIVE